MALDATKEHFEEIEFQGKSVLFTDCRVKRDTVPEGLHRYEIRHTDDDWGEPCQLGYGIMVNHFGTILTNEAIQLDPGGHLDFDAEEMNYGDNGHVSVAEYLERHPPVDKAVFEVFPIDSEKVDWLYSDEAKDKERGVIGHLRGDFGSGNEFWTTWWPHQNDTLNTQTFKSELDALVNWLRQNGGPLSGLSGMNYFCQLRANNAKVDSSLNAYGFQIETPERQYYLRCSPVRGDYTFYLYCCDKTAQREHAHEMSKDERPSVLAQLKSYETKDKPKTAPKRSAEREL